jgi:transposase
VAVVQACRDLDITESVLRRWMRETAADRQQAFPGHGQVKPEQLEIDRLRREVAKLKAERDILKNSSRAGVRPTCGGRNGSASLDLGGERPISLWWR